MRERKIVNTANKIGARRHKPQNLLAGGGARCSLKVSGAIKKYRAESDRAFSKEEPPVLQNSQNNGQEKQQGEISGAPPEKSAGNPELRKKKMQIAETHAW